MHGKLLLLISMDMYKYKITYFLVVSHGKLLDIKWMGFTLTHWRYISLEDLILCVYVL